ncbi:hypothetical protein FS837_003824 [Tulasnella sp. UAMH 9824]|nr:hypothetical protein FS837_003824 [Tulasnella sp. UAMH 9824]
MRARPGASSGGMYYGRRSRRARRRDRRLKGDLKTAAEFGGLQMSEYDVMFHIPYGPGIDTKRITKIVYQTDVGLNSTFNPKNKGRRLHRHPFFFGNMKEALGDCCRYCPVPKTDEEKEMFEKEQEQFITGRVSFMQEDPGRQSITGSFHPIDSGEWSEQAYLKPLAKLYSYIASHNRPACSEFLKRNAEAINTRDHLGRTPLQFALLCSAEDICLDIIEQGGRMTARMVDGRCSLHLAAQMGLSKVVKALLEKSEKNKAENEVKEREAKENARKDKDVKMKDRDNEIRDSSEDDWSSEDDEEKDYEEAKKKVDPKGDPDKNEEDLLEDSEDIPDILDIDATDWDQCLTALGMTNMAMPQYAIISGSLASVQILAAVGADCKTPRTLGASHQNSTTFYPLTLTALTPDESIAAQIAEQLITVGGASCAAADSATITVFHRLFSLNKPQIVETILKVDPTAKAASRFLHTAGWQSAVHPIVSAFAAGHRAMVAVLLAYAGTRPFIDLETYDRSIAANPNQGGGYGSYARAGEEYWKTFTLQPLEASLADHNDLYHLVLALEPESVKNFVPRSVHQCQAGTPGFRRSMLDVLQSAFREAKRRSREQPVTAQPNIASTYYPTSNWRSVLNLSDSEILEKTGWEAYAIGLEKRTKAITDSKVQPTTYNTYSVFGSNNTSSDEKTRAQAAKLIPYLQQAVEELEKAGAQTWDAIYQDAPSQWKIQYGSLDIDPDDPNPPTPQSTANQLFNGAPAVQANNYGEDYPGTHLIPLYDELYEACWVGDNDKIKALCLPPDGILPPQSGTRDLLQITSRVKYTEQDSNYAQGYTPLYVALRARRWDTARLILDIAQKQLMKEEDDPEVPKPVRQSANIITFNDSDDDSDGDSCASDETEKRPVGYTNLARRFHTVSVKVKPSQLLSYDGKWATESISGPDASFGTADPITLAVFENDLEAFHQIADMMEGLEESMAIPLHHLQTILANDSPEMLDAFIRRTGEGLSLPEPKAQKSTDDEDSMQDHDGDDDGPKVYLGLDVEGKKQKDLARREDPNAPYAYAGMGYQIPIAWTAASKQATTILEYLNSPRAFEAYKYYAESKKTILANRLAEVFTNADNFPEMVGFSVSRYAETPVLATVWNPAKPDKILPTLKKLMELQPRLTADGVRLQVKPGRMSPLLLLCQTKAPVEVFDWMMTNGADPLLRDERGWNILHILFNSADLNWELIEHVLTKLPAGVTQTLMAQQSRTERNTPFAVAVKKANVRLLELLVRIAKDAVGPSLLLRDRTGTTPLHSAVLTSNLKVVELLVQTMKDEVVPSLLLRDTSGATPFHSAILQGYSKIVSHLISIGPPEMLYLENAVGSTPMEITRLQFLTLSLRELLNPLAQPIGFNTSGVDVLPLNKAPGMRDRDENEVKSLRRVIDGIKSSGALARKPELFKVLSDFTDRSEHEFAIWVAQKPKDEVSPAESTTNNRNDVTDVKATFEVFSKAVVEVHQRQLVPLRDVQLAVLTAVESSNGGLSRMPGRRVRVSEDSELGEAQDSGYSIILGRPGYDSVVYPTSSFGLFY